MTLFYKIGTNILNNRKLIQIYEIVMALLSILVVTILIIDLSYTLPKNIIVIFSVIDNIILVIFCVDYFTRLFISKDKIRFIKSNVVDLISIIPVNSAFQSLRIFRLTKMLKFVKFIKIFKSLALLLKFRKYIDKFLKTNNFNYIIWITLFTLFLGAMGIHFAEGISIGNSFWWSFVTISTVGYGDISPVTPIGRIIAGIIMLVGIGFLGMLTATIATFFLNKNYSTNFKSQTIEDIKKRLDNFDELNIKY